MIEMVMIATDCADVSVVSGIEHLPPENVNLWKSLFAEFIGVFTLVFIGGGAAAATIEEG